MSNPSSTTRLKRLRQAGSAAPQSTPAVPSANLAPFRATLVPVTPNPSPSIATATVTSPDKTAALGSMAGFSTPVLLVNKVKHLSNAISPTTSTPLDPQKPPMAHIDFTSKQQHLVSSTSIPSTPSIEPVPTPNLFNHSWSTPSYSSSAETTLDISGDSQSSSIQSLDERFRSLSDRERGSGVMTSIHFTQSEGVGLLVNSSDSAHPPSAQVASTLDSNSHQLPPAQSDTRNRLNIDLEHFRKEFLQPAPKPGQLRSFRPDTQERFHEVATDLLQEQLARREAKLEQARIARLEADRYDHLFEATVCS